MHFAQMDIASHFANTMTFKTLNQYIQKATQFQELTRFKIPNVQGADLTLLSCISGTFLLEQYRYENKCFVEKDDIILDCGCCLADTAIWFMRNGAKEVHSFEIDRTYLQVAQLNVEEFGYKNAIHIYPFALSDHEGKINYTPDKSISTGTIGDNKSNTSYEVDCITIDKFCQTYNVSPSFIKIEIEGAEESALHGDINVIKTYRSKLAICIYHKWEHRWTIPLFIKEICDSYSYYIKRSHPYNETVIFCVPKK